MKILIFMLFSWSVLKQFSHVSYIQVPSGLIITMIFPYLLFMVEVRIFGYVHVL